MKKKILIVIADYYKDIAKGLLGSAKEVLPKSSLINSSHSFSNDSKKFLFII